MVVSPFGELKLGDHVALEMWLDAHARRHSAERQATGLPGNLLHGPVDGDWFFRHWADHVTLATFQGIQLLSGTKALALPHRWRTQQELIDWNELHNRVHLLQDRQLGIV